MVINYYRVKVTNIRSLFMPVYPPTEAYTCHCMFFNYLFVDFNLGIIDFKLGKSTLILDKSTVILEKNRL